MFLFCHLMAINDKIIFDLQFLMIFESSINLTSNQQQIRKKTVITVPQNRHLFLAPAADHVKLMCEDTESQYLPNYLKQSVLPLLIQDFLPNAICDLVHILRVPNYMQIFTCTCTSHLMTKLFIDSNSLKGHSRAVLSMFANFNMEYLHVSNISPLGSHFWVY